MAAPIFEKMFVKSFVRAGDVDLIFGKPSRQKLRDGVIRTGDLRVDPHAERLLPVFVGIHFITPFRKTAA